MALNRREALILGGVGLGAAVAGLLIGPIVLQSRTGAAELRSARFRDLQGKERGLGDWADRILVCNFWATWCSPCIEEIPLLISARERFAGNGVEVVGIALDSLENVVKFVRTVPITYPVLVSGVEGLDLLRRLGNSAGGLPYSVVLDRAGAIAEYKLGAFKSGELDTLLRRLTGN